MLRVVGLDSEWVSDCDCAICVVAIIPESEFNAQFWLLLFECKLFTFNVDLTIGVLCCKLLLVENELFNDDWIVNGGCVWILPNVAPSFDVEISVWWLLFIRVDLLIDVAFGFGSNNYLPFGDVR